MDNNSAVYPPLRVKPSRAKNFWRWVFWESYSLLVFFGLRQPVKYWGIVYDSITKQPLDPAIVKLTYLGRKQVQTKITDLNGRYGFLAEPGKFKILVRKSNYKFPSTIVTGGQDGVYDNLYHGEFFELWGDSEVVAPNIPLDPVAADWNQNAKRPLVHYSPYLRSLWRMLMKVVFWGGVLLTACVYVFHLTQLSYAGHILAIVYAGLLFLAVVIPAPKLWGQMLVKNSEPASEFHIELQNKRIPGVSFGQTATNAEGKFLLLVQPGNYMLHIFQKNQQGVIVRAGQCKVRVGRRGILAKVFQVSA